MKIPPIGSECRQAVIRDAHQQISALGSPSFRNTALRLGLKEAEVIYAHSEVCRGITPINLTDDIVWDIIHKNASTQWALQLGESSNWLKINDSINQIDLLHDSLTLSGDNWKLIINELSNCHAFVIGCNKANSRFRITIYDSYGHAQAVLMPQTETGHSTLKHDILHYVQRRPMNTPIKLSYDEHISEQNPQQDSHSLATFIEQCRERDLDIYLSRENQFKSIIMGEFLSHEQDGREFYYNIGGPDIKIDHDSTHTLNYAARGACMEALGNNGSKYTVGLLGSARTGQVLSWMELIEQYKVAS